MYNIIKPKKYFMTPPSFGVVVSTSFTTFDPSNTGIGQTLSNGNLTVENTNSSNGISRTIANHSSGKYYAEFIFTGGNIGIGVVSGSDSITTFIGGVGVGVGYNGGYIGSVSGTTTAPAITATNDGHVFGVAVDVSNRAMWLKDITAAGFWNANATANPATNVNGAILGGSVASGAIYLGETCGNLNDTITFNFGAMAYTGIPPVGFGNW